MNWCILIPLLVGLISALLGYLLGKSLGGGSNYDDSSDRIAKLEADLEACRASKSTNVASSFAAGAAATGIAFDADAAKAVYGKRIKENDLTVVEGIGPKIQELFHNHDVKTWRGLSECSVDKCQSVLDSGGDRYKIHNPGTWPKQAKMAYEGRWADLLKWQDELDGGK
jgi:predicted flap endonuclease-1-like 5' DNA nuclease